VESGHCLRAGSTLISGDVWGLGEVQHNKEIGLDGWLLNALKIRKKGAHFRPHSGIQLPIKFQLQGVSPPPDLLTRGSALAIDRESGFF